MNISTTLSQTFETKFKHWFSSSCPYILDKYTGYFHKRYVIYFKNSAHSITVRVPPVFVQVHESERLDCDATIKRSAGVAPEVRLRNLHSSDEAGKWGDPPWL